MKKITLLITFYLTLIISSYAQIKFIHQSLDEALEKAKKENKYIIVDVHAVWCGPCKKMAATTFQDKDVSDFVNKNMVALKLDGEKKGGPEFATKHGVRAYPTLIVLDPSGKKIKQKAGAMNVTSFMNFVGEYKTKGKTKVENSFSNENYFDARNSFISNLQEQIRKEENGTFIQQAMLYGKEHQDFEFGELKYQAKKEKKIDLIPILEVYFQLAQKDYDKAMEVFHDNLISMETLSKSQLHYLILEFLKNDKLTPQFLILLNEHAVKTKDTGILETKALLQYKLNELKDAKETLVKTKKVIKKAKEETPKSIQLLEKAI